MSTLALRTGVCRYCGCTQGNACRLPDGDTCSWFLVDRTLCNAPGCVKQHYEDDLAERHRAYNRFMRYARGGRKKKRS